MASYNNRNLSKCWSENSFVSKQHGKTTDTHYDCTCFADIYDFKANVFSLSVTICPDD